jgi:hypothetical protein
MKLASAAFFGVRSGAVRVVLMGSPTFLVDVAI